MKNKEVKYKIYRKEIKNMAQKCNGLLYIKVVQEP